MNNPHGGSLISRMLSEKQSANLREKISEYPSISVSPSMADIVQNIGQGVLSPLRGFMTENETINVLDHMRLSTDVPWTIPIVLDVVQTNTFSVGDSLALTQNGTGIGLEHTQQG